MATLIHRITPRDVAYTGLISGLIFAAFEVVASGYLEGSAAAAMPLRMISAIVLGRAALDPHYSLALAATTGIMMILLLAVLFAGVFATIVSRIARATEGELLTGKFALECAGMVFGTVLWLVGFYVVAPLAGWSWFPANVHHEVQFVAHAWFFGCPLGWLWGQVSIATDLPSDHRHSHGSTQILYQRTYDVSPLVQQMVGTASATVAVTMQTPARPTDAWSRSISRLPGVRTDRTGFNADLLLERMPTILIALTMVMFVAFCLWLVAMYIGIEYVRPPWDTHSVPPESLY